MDVAIRVDASVLTGLGHLRRCLSLASAIKSAGGSPTLYWRHVGIDAGQIIARSGIAQIQIESGLCVDETLDARAFVTASATSVPEITVVDHYGLTAEWHDAVREAFAGRIAVIDDLANRKLAPDVLVDQNPSADYERKFAACLRREGVRILGGPQFALLDEEFARIYPRAVHDPVRSIGVFMGGTDPVNATPTVVRACRDVAAFCGPIEVVTTSANPRLGDWLQSFADDPATTITVDQANLAAFYLRHDLHVGAGGGAAWERCCAGVPSVAVAVADNQNVVIAPLGAAGAVLAVAQIDAQLIGQALSALLRDVELRRTMSGRARALVDGAGARRVALCLLSGTIRVRDASMADAGMIFPWRNSARTRKASRDGRELSLQSHLRWVEKTLNGRTSWLWIAQVGTLDVGVVRFDPVSNGTVEISLYLDPELYGLGLGPAMLRVAEQRMATEVVGLQTIRAAVLPGNVASQMLFRNYGYVENGQYFVKKLTPGAAIAVSSSAFSGA